MSGERAKRISDQLMNISFRLDEHNVGGILIELDLDRIQKAVDDLYNLLAATEKGAGQ